MRQEVTVPMTINHRSQDKIPVKVGDTVVGWVLEVRITYILDGQEHTQVVMDIEDDALAWGISAHMETQRPIFSVFFPRTAHDTHDIFGVR